MMRNRRFADLMGAALAGTGALALITLTGGGSPAFAASNQGELTLSTPGGTDLTEGGSATEFTFEFASPGECAGDSVSGGNLIQGFIAPASVDPSTLTFDVFGPVASVTGIHGLLNTSDVAYVDVFTGQPTAAGGPAPIPTVPAFTLATYRPANLPEGDYNIGVACTTGFDARTIDRYWTAPIEITHDELDFPGGFTWSAEVSGGETSTTSTSVAGSSTTTVVGGSTTSTTVAGGSTTSTTVAGSSTTSTTVAGSSTSSTTIVRSNSNFPPSNSNNGSNSPQLAVTGSSSPWRTVLWAIVVVAIGRMVFLTSRHPRIIPDDRR